MKRFPDEQIISILRRSQKLGVPARELCRKRTISDATFYTGVRSMAVWRCLKLSAWGREGREHQTQKLLAGSHAG